MVVLRGLSFLFLALACCTCIDFGSHSCTELYPRCNVTSVTIQSPGNAWSAETYALSLVVDGASQQCAIVISDPPAAATGTCSATGTALTLTPVCPQPPPVCTATTCSETVSSANCLPGQFTMQLTIGTPFGPFEAGVEPHVVGMLALDLSVEGTELLHESVAPKATTTEPNGAGCGTCTNATATLPLAGG